MSNQPLIYCDNAQARRPPANITPADAKLMEMKEYTLAEIARMFPLPASLVPRMDNVHDRLNEPSGR